MVNLINNAIDSFKLDENHDQTIGKNINNKKKLIIISFTKNDDFNILSIKDSGCGIDEEVIDKIFNPFFSLKNKKEDRFDHYHCGVGLNIVKKIIENDFSGKIEVKSEIGQGTEFIITF